MVQFLMKKIILMMFMIFGTSMLFAQFPRFKFLQIQKDTTAGSILISSFSDSNMVYSRDFFINELDSSLILFGDTIALKNSISVFTDNTITGNGLTGSPLRVDTSIIATTTALNDSLAGFQSFANISETVDTVYISDYLDVDNSTLYVDAVNNRVGIGRKPDHKFSIFKEDSITSTISRTIEVLNYDTYTGTGAKYQQTILATGRQFVPTGLNNTGYLNGITFDVTTGYGPAGNSGSLTQITGMQFNVGIESLNGNAPTVTNVTGLNIWPFYQAGSVTNLYGLKLQNASTGGSVTNYYGIYQEDSNADNYFNGNVGIGTPSPSAKLNVEGGDVNFDSGTLFVDESENRVGIGTTTPSSTIELSLSGHISNLETNKRMVLSNDDPNYNAVTLLLNGKQKNSNLGFGQNDTVKAGITYDTRGFLGFINSVYHPNDFSLRLEDNGNLRYYDYPSQSNSFLIEADGDVYMPRITNNSSGDYDLRITTTGELVYQISSVRFKENITDFEKGLDYVLQLRPVKFNYITDSTDTKLVGFIAEQLSEIGLEEGVVYKTDGTVEGINNTIYNPILVNAIKEQQAIIESQESKIQTLESTIETLQQQMQDLINRMIIMENQ